MTTGFFIDPKYLQSEMAKSLLVLLEERWLELRVAGDPKLMNASWRELDEAQFHSAYDPALLVFLHALAQLDHRVTPSQESASRVEYYARLRTDEA